MAVPSYTTDLTSGLIHACDAASASWTEPTGFLGGAITLPETDYYIQNTGCLSKNCGTTTPIGVGAIYNYGSGISVPANGAVMTWLFFGAPNTLAAQAAGGLQIFSGSATSAFKQWYVRGSDTYPYGGWVCIPVNPTVETGAATINVVAAAGTFTRSSGSFLTNGFAAGQTIVTTGFTNAGNNTTKVISSVTDTVITVTVTTGLVNETGNADEQIRQCDTITGSPSTTNQYIGAGAYIPGTAIASKGNPFGLDVLRFGRCEARIADGSTADGYATFSGYTAINDAVANRWGLIQAVQGGYLTQGLVIFGYSTAVDFRDSNKTILIADTQKVTSTFNAFEVRQAGSRVDLTSISFLALGTTSKGNWITTDNATINISGCSFTDMGTFSFQSNSTLLTTTFRRCGLVTQGSGVFTGCRFESSPAAASILSNNPALITNSTFVSDGSNHAIELTTACAGNTYSLSGGTFTNYATSNGSTGNEVIYNNSGGAVIINASGCSGSISYRNGTNATTTVNNTITLTLTGLISGSDIVILDAGTTTERANIDNNIPTTYAYGYTDSGSYVDIGLFKAGYIPKYVRNFLLATTNASLPIEQVLDRNYIP